MNSASTTPKSKANDTIKVVFSFSIFLSFIALCIVVYRQGAISNEQQVQLLGINEKLIHMKEYLDSSSILQFQVQEIQQSMISIRDKHELQTQTDSKDILQLKIQMEKALYQIDSNGKEFDLYRQEKNLNGQSDSDLLGSLKEQVVKILVQMEVLQKDVEKISSQINTHSQTLNEQIFQWRINQNDIENIKKQSDAVIQLSKDVGVLQSDSLKLQTSVQLSSPKVEANYVNIDSIKNDLMNVSSQLLNLKLVVAALPNNNTSNNNNVESEIATIKQQIVDLKSQIPDGRLFNSIEEHGPFVPPYAFNKLTLEGTGFSYYPTTAQCSIKTKGKALITLIATGIGICNQCQAQMAFLKNRKSDLPKAGANNRLNGASFLWPGWLPINMTQQFLVDEGTHEFIFGISLTDTFTSFTAEFASLSFVATVIYYE